MKSEPESYAIDDLRRDKRTAWDGVRNYQARNFLRAMRVGDRVLFYHSNAKPSGVAGLAKVVRTAYPDPTAFDPKDHHYDPASDPDDPRWDMVDVGFVEAFPRVLALQELAQDPHLEGMLLLSGKAMRLSVQPVEGRHFKRIVALGRKAAAPEPARR